MTLTVPGLVALLPVRSSDAAPGSRSTSCPAQPSAASAARDDARARPVGPATPMELLLERPRAGASAASDRDEAPPVRLDSGRRRGPTTPASAALRPRAGSVPLHQTWSEASPRTAFADHQRQERRGSPPRPARQPPSGAHSNCAAGSARATRSRHPRAPSIVRGSRTTPSWR